jgi:hypothetical protein
MVDDQRIAIASILSDCEAGAREVHGVPSDSMGGPRGLRRALTCGIL